MKARAVAVLALVAAVAAAIAASTAGAGSSSATASQVVNCNGTLKIGIITPLTGGAGFLGQEQLSWTQYAVSRLARGLGLQVQLVRGDTPVEKGPGEGLVVAQKMIADSRLVAVIGPATSGAVAAASQALFAAGIAHISPSATRTSLTKGSNKEATPAFFRVVPGDYIQGPTDANFMADKLNAKKVVLIDFQEPYSVGLADSTEAALKRKGVTTDPAVDVGEHDRLLVARHARAERRGHRVLPDAAAARRADVRSAAARAGQAGEGVRRRRGEQPGAVQARRLVRLELRTGHQRHRLVEGADRRLEEGEPERDSSARSGRRPTSRRRSRCRRSSGRASPARARSNTRRDVIRQVKKVRVPDSILGGAFRFSTKTNDPLNAKFYIFQIQPNGTYKLVG